MCEGEKSVVLTPLAAELKLTGQGVAAVADSASKLDINDFGGGRSSTSLDASGSIHIATRDALPRGRDNEPSVLDVLRLLVCGTIELGDDSRGEDGILRSKAGTFTIQIVSVPPEPEFNRQVRQGENVERVLAIPEAAGWIHASIQKKCAGPPTARTTVILVLDARHLGILAEDAILGALREGYPDVACCGFWQVWLIGPTAARSVRLA
jgi:hypothetical protein